jgi:hypothetical protein
LENFCFYCKVIKSGRTFHCMFCNRCIEKFDHHCSFVNNCLGYRNHRFFLIFITTFVFYFITSTVASALSFGSHDKYDPSSFDGNLDFIFRIASITFNVTQLIPVIFQVKEQTRKLCKKGSRFKGVRRMRV